MASIGFRTDSREADVAAIVARRHDNGGDFWATADGRVYVGIPFSTIASLAMLHELGVPTDHEAVQGGLELILGVCRDDGCIRVAPRGAPVPLLRGRGGARAVSLRTR